MNQCICQVFVEKRESVNKKAEKCSQKNYIFFTNVSLYLTSTVSDIKLTEATKEHSNESQNNVLRTS